MERLINLLSQRRSGQSIPELDRLVSQIKQAEQESLMKLSAIVARQK